MARQEYLDQADRLIGEFGRLRNQLDAIELRRLLDQVIASLQDVRILQERYDSGEKAVQQLYDRYLPYLAKILRQYIRMESSGSYEALMELQKQLKHTLEMIQEALHRTAEVLPMDEMEEAAAEKMAVEKKEELDQQRKKKKS